MRSTTANANTERRGSGLMMNWEEVPDRVLHNHAGWGEYPGITAIGKKAGEAARGTPSGCNTEGYTYIVFDANMNLLFSGSTKEIVCKFPDILREKISKKASSREIYKGKYYFRKDSTPIKGFSNRAGGRHEK